MKVKKTDKYKYNFSVYRLLIKKYKLFPYNILPLPDRFMQKKDRVCKILKHYITTGNRL